MAKDNLFEFEAVPWLFHGEKGEWMFVTLPDATSSEIKQAFCRDEDGFGALRVEVRCGERCWRTSIFPDVFLDDHESRYELPLKVDAKKNLAFEAGRSTKFELWLES